MLANLRHLSCNILAAAWADDLHWKSVLCSGGKNSVRLPSLTCCLACHRELLPSSGLSRLGLPAVFVPSWSLQSEADFADTAYLLGVSRQH